MVTPTRGRLAMRVLSATPSAVFKEPLVEHHASRAGLPPGEAPSTRPEELRSFLFFTVVMAPVLAVLVVGGYGFVVWMYQLVTGPPMG